MKYLLIATVVLFGGILLLGPMTDSLALPAGVAAIMEDLGGVFWARIEPRAVRPPSSVADLFSTRPNVDTS